MAGAVHFKLLGADVSFRFKDEPQVILSTYEVRDAFLVKLRAQPVQLLMGRVVNPQKGTTHYPLIAVVGDRAFHFCGGDMKGGLLKLLGSVFMELEILNLHGKVPAELEEFFALASSSSAECWRKNEQAPNLRVHDRSVGCKHGYVLASYYRKGGQVKEVDLSSLVSSSTQGGEKSLVETVLDYSFREHVLLIGEQGSGKTYTAWEVVNHLRSQDESVEVFFVQGSPAVEAPDLLGRYIKTKGGELQWLDGPLARAFRHAGISKDSTEVEKRKMGKSILLVDEFPRIPLREQGIFISALSPVLSRKGNKFYVLFNPLNGEEIWTPTQNLWVIATGNMGMEFSHSALSDPALQERFISLWVDTTEETLKRVLEPLLAEKGWTELLPLLLNLRKVGEEFKEKGELSTAPSLRVLKKAVELSASKEDLPEKLIVCFPAMSREEREAWKQVVITALGGR